MRMADKETVSDWGILLSRHLQILAASFPDRFPPDHVAKLKRDHFYGRLPKRLKAMVAYLKVRPQVRTYSDYLRAAREAEKEDSIELSRGSRMQTTDGPSKLRPTSFFPLRKLKGSQPFPKKPAICLAQLEEEDASDSEDPGSEDPDGIEGVTEEFMVWLARAVKDAQTDKRHCYHCSSFEHFIHNCLLMKSTRDKKPLNGKEGMVMAKGAWTPPKATNAIKSPKRSLKRHRVMLTDSLLESGPFPTMVWYGEHGQSEDKWGKLHGLTGQWGTSEHYHPEVCKGTFPSSGANN